MQIMTTATLALIILAVILAQVAIVMLLGLYRRRRQFDDLDKGMDGVENTSKFNTSAHSSVESPISNLTWDGFKEFIAQRREIEDGNNSICSFYLVPADNKPLPIYRPGQFLTFKLQIEDPAVMN